MFKCLGKGLLAGLVIKQLGKYRSLLLQLLKLEAVQCYLHGVRVARLAALSLVRMGLEIGLICSGVLLFHMGLFFLLPWTMVAKAILGMILGLLYVAIGSVALYVAMDEKTWLDKSGVAKLLEEAIGQSSGD